MHAASSSREATAATPAKTKGRLRDADELMGEQADVHGTASSAPPAGWAAAHGELGAPSSAVSVDVRASALVAIVLMVAVMSVVVAAVASAVEREVVESIAMLGGGGGGVNLRGCAVRSGDCMAHTNRPPIMRYEGPPAPPAGMRWRERDMGGEHAAGRTVVTMPEVMMSMKVMSAETIASSTSPTSQATATAGSENGPHGEDRGTSYVGRRIVGALTGWTAWRRGHRTV